ncbi:ABC-three component system middle component 8 [Agromyces sp. NPDC058136]|uniref:ABC-three component system middle component 8 n=1 Tax=Agromyces sp. NPDC058136 TaxID=3346354 RepID=UPI0036DB204B
MLKPTKHSHPDKTVLAAATIALRELRKQRAVSFDDLRDRLDSRGSDGNYLLVPAISLLFLLGLVEYLPKIDSFEYVGEL